MSSSSPSAALKSSAGALYPSRSDARQFARRTASWADTGALGVAQALRVLNGQPAGENAPLSEVVGVAPLPEMNIAHWLYSPLSLLLAAAFPDITRQPPRSRYQLK
jgi:hypothetical protein